LRRGATVPGPGVPHREPWTNERSDADATPYAAATSPARRRRARLPQYGGLRGGARAGASTGSPTARRYRVMLAASVTSATRRSRPPQSGQHEEGAAPGEAGVPRVGRGERRVEVGRATPAQVVRHVTWQSKSAFAKSSSRPAGDGSETRNDGSEPSVSVVRRFFTASVTASRTGGAPPPATASRRGPRASPRLARRPRGATPTSAREEVREGGRAPRRVAAFIAAKPTVPCIVATSRLPTRSPNAKAHR